MHNAARLSKISPNITERLKPLNELKNRNKNVVLLKLVLNGEQANMVIFILLVLCVN